MCASGQIETMLESSQQLSGEQFALISSQNRTLYNMVYYVIKSLIYKERKDGSVLLLGNLITATLPFNDLYKMFISQEILWHFTAGKKTGSWFWQCPAELFDQRSRNANYFNNELK